MEGLVALYPHFLLTSRNIKVAMITGIIYVSFVNAISTEIWFRLCPTFQLKVMQEHKGERSMGSLSVAAEVFHFKLLEGFLPDKIFVPGMHFN